MRPSWTLFPKLYGELPVQELAEVIRFASLDTTNVVIRKGYEVDEENLASALPLYISAAGRKGLHVTRAETTFSAELLISPASPLPILRDCGIREFRMGWFPRAGKDVRSDYQRARSFMEQVAEAAKQYGVKAVYQLHHRTLIASPTAAYGLVQQLDPRWIGVELDPGNQSFEGYEPWDYACGLLDKYVAWVGVKDTRVWQEMPHSEEAGKGWRRDFCPVYEGVTNWQDVIRALASISFTGPLVFMPFYDEDDTALRTHKLRGEVEYVRALVETTRA